MKATTLLAVCILCTQSKLGSNFTGASSLALDSVIGIAVRHKQQVQEPEVCSDEEVFLRTHTASCDPNLGQRYVDIRKDCDLNGNNAFDARRFIGSCSRSRSRNENGRFCFEFQQTLSSYTDHLQSNCPFLDSYSDYECTDMCNAALQSFKSNVGCCLNSFFNISGYDRNYQFNNAGLWSACSVSPPGFCKATYLTLGSGTTSRKCSIEDRFENTYTQIVCNGQTYQPILDIYLQCERPTYELFIGLSGLSETKLCALSLNNSEMYLQEVESQCQNYTEGCTPSCYTALNTFKTDLGCCGNIMFITTVYLCTKTLPILTCGQHVELPPQDSARPHSYLSLPDHQMIPQQYYQQEFPHSHLSLLNH